MSIASAHQAEPIGSLRLELGEGPVWSPQERRVYCVDIERHTVYRICSRTAKIESHTVRNLPSALALTQSGRLLVATRDGLVYLNFNSGETAPLSNPIAHRPAARLNDGKVAPDGSFWVGSMQNNIGAHGEPISIKQNIGGLYRATADGQISALLPEQLGIANTLAWSPDQKYFYYADSLKGVLYRVACEDGRIAHTATVFNADFPRGVPDGSAMDEDGFLWNARWGGGCVVRFAPDGRADQVIDVPATNISSCAFGGDDNRTLFITSARSSLSPDVLTRHPYEGAIFALATDVRGMTVPVFSD